MNYCSNLFIDTDDSAKYLYGICEIKNGTNQDLKFFSGYHRVSGSPPQPEIVLDYQNFSGPESLMHPQIFDDDILLLYRLVDELGQQNLVHPL